MVNERHDFSFGIYNYSNFLSSVHTTLSSAHRETGVRWLCNMCADPDWSTVMFLCEHYHIIQQIVTELGSNVRQSLRGVVFKIVRVQDKLVAKLCMYIKAGQLIVDTKRVYAGLDDDSTVLAEPLLALLLLAHASVRHNLQYELARVLTLNDNLLPAFVALQDYGRCPVCNTV